MRVSIASQSGRTDGRNEDWAGATSRVAIVLDGLSESPETGCVHGTPWFVSQLGTRLLTHAENLERSLTDALAEAITDVAALHSHTCDLAHPGSPCTTVAVLRENTDRYDYLVLSDSTVVIDTVGGLQVVTDKSVDTVALAEAAAANAVAFGQPEHWQLYQALIAAQQQVRNTANGYWVAQTDPAAADHATTGSVDAQQFRGGLVMSDGATRPVTDFGEWTWPQLVEYAYTHGPQALITHTRTLEQTDPDGTRWKRYKITDDASAVVCRP